MGKYLFLLALLLPLSAEAAPLCGKRADLVGALENQYAEQPVSIAVTDDNRLLEVFRTKDGTTWTLLVTEPKGRTCVVTTGEDWTDLNAKYTEEPRV